MESITLEVSRFTDHLKFEKRYSVHTVRSYGDDLDQFVEYINRVFGPMELVEVTTSIARSWLASLKEEGLHARSITRKISALKSFFKFALRTGSVVKNPVSTLTTPKLPKRLPAYVEEEDIKTLLKDVAFTNDWKGYTGKLAIQMLYELGIRLSELVNCRESQVDFANGQVKVLGKGNKERIIPAGNALLANMREYMQKKRAEFAEPDKVYLLVNDNGKKVYAKYIYRITTAYLPEVTTISKKSPHILRHSFATHLSNNGAELNAVKELLGHASLAATQVYTHNSIDKLKNVHKKAHPRG
jgi:integrase/recombinase XerC